MTREHPSHIAAIELLNETLTQIDKYNQALEELDYIYLDVSPCGNSYNVWVHEDYLGIVTGSDYPDTSDDWNQLDLPTGAIMPGIDINMER